MTHSFPTRRSSDLALENGVAGWASVGLPMVPETVLPTRDSEGRTVWVTRGRPKVDRIACPWLIRRFVDPSAIFLFVAPSEVQGVAERFGAASFDIEVEGIVWRSEEHTSELQSLMRISYAVFCLKQKHTNPL